MERKHGVKEGEVTWARVIELVDGRGGEVTRARVGLHGVNQTRSCPDEERPGRR